MDVKGKTKGVLTTYDCTYREELKDREQTGIISVDKLLENEFKDSKSNSIYFCDKDHVVCLCNHSNSTYIEPVHEYFDSAYQVTYLVCDSENSYNNLKFYIGQSSKYHSVLKEVNEIPYKKSFEILFYKNDKFDKKENVKFEEKSLSKKNYYEMEGQIINIGKEFVKKDKSKAKIISINQEYDYNDKINTNTMSVMLEKKVLDDYRNKLKLNDIVRISGAISVYKDKNNQNRIIVNCNDLEVINNKKEKDFER